MTLVAYRDNAGFEPAYRLPALRPDWNRAAVVTRGNRDSIEHSILDLVREDAKGLQRTLGFSDRRKIEEYLDGLRGIERRIEWADRDDYSHHQEAFRKIR